MKNNKGITLASLVLTIIVLLILASIFVYSGVNTVRYTKFNKAKSEISVVQTNVNSWYQELKNIENTDEYKALQTDDEKQQYKNNFLNDKGYGVTTDDPACSQKKLDDTLQGLNDKGIEIENFDNYRFLSSKFLENKLGLNASYDFLANIEDRTVILFGGLEYNGEWYYTMEDFGLTNIKSNTISGITFDLAQGDNTEIVISNLKMTDNENNKIDFSKFIVEYQKKGEANWTDVTKDIIKFEDGEENNKTTKYKFTSGDIGEYIVKISTIDKKNSKEDEIEIDGTYAPVDLDGAMELLAETNNTNGKNQELKNVVMTTSDPDVATITTEGIVKSNKVKGEAIISAKKEGETTPRYFKVKSTATLATPNKMDSNKTINGKKTGTANNPIIPKDFYPVNTAVAKWTYDNTNNKVTDVDKGLVIMDEKGNQFVWVPVRDIKDMVMCANNNKDGHTCNIVFDGTNISCTAAGNSTEIVGKLYATSTGESFGTVNQTYTEDSGLREPDAVTDYDNKQTQYTVDDRATQLSKFKEMAISVAKNGGFYVGRYESSLINRTTRVVAGASSMSAKEDSANMWYGLYAKQNSYASENGVSSSVVSNMIWGSQYDAIMNWIANGDNTKIKDNSGTNSNSDGARRTGSKPTDKLNNIFDLYGLRLEWTMEAYYTLEWTMGAYYTGFRVCRGGDYYGNTSPSYRAFTEPYGAYGGYSSRPTLYIQ